VCSVSREMASPVVELVADAVAWPPNPSTASLKQLNNLAPKDIHVLLVDDERLSRIVVGNLLRKCGYKGALAGPLRHLSRFAGALSTPLPLYVAPLSRGLRRTLQ